MRDKYRSLKIVIALEAIILVAVIAASFVVGTGFTFIEQIRMLMGI